MNNINNTVKKYFHWIVIVLLLLVFFKSCGISSECTRNRNEITELTNELNKKDSIIDVAMNAMNHKLDSTLISNSAVVSSNNSTSNAINNQKQQQVVVKLLPNKE